MKTRLFFVLDRHVQMLFLERCPMRRSSPVRPGPSGRLLLLLALMVAALATAIHHAGAFATLTHPDLFEQSSAPADVLGTNGIGDGFRQCAELTRQANLIAQVRRGVMTDGLLFVWHDTVLGSLTVVRLRPDDSMNVMASVSPFALPVCPYNNLRA